MMSRIEAGERLAAIGDRALAAGNVKKPDARKALRRMEEARDGVRRGLAKATPAVLAGMGIGLATATRPGQASAPSQKPVKRV